MRQHLSERELAIESINQTDQRIGPEGVDYLLDTISALRVRIRDIEIESGKFRAHLQQKLDQCRQQREELRHVQDEFQHMRTGLKGLAERPVTMDVAENIDAACRELQERARIVRQILGLDTAPAPQVRHFHIESQGQGVAHVVCNDCGWLMGIPIEHIIPSEAIGIAAEQHPYCRKDSAGAGVDGPS